MARVKSEFLSGYLIMAGIIKALVDEVKNLNGSDEDLRRIETDPALRRQIAGLLVQSRATEESKPFSVEIHLAQWVKFYREVMNLEIDLNSIRIPEHVTGFDRLIVVMPGMTPEKLFQLCKSRFSGWKWTDKSLDEIVTSERTATDGPYAIWVRDRVEADDELTGKSYNDLKVAGVSGVTLEERLLDELEYHFRIQKHKDIKNVTLCSGSRYSDGSIPGVDWRGGSDELHVRRYHVDSRYDDLRSRQAVSLPKAA